MLKPKLNRLLITVIALTTVACSNHGAGDGVEVKFHRFEQLLFATPAQNLQQTLISAQPEYNTDLLNIAPLDEQYMAMVQGFVADPVVSDIYAVVDSLYHDLGWVEVELTSALGRAKHLCPSINYNHFYTLITADFQDYRNRVFCDDHSLAISIDRYALPALGRYQYFGVPIYLVNLCTRDYIVADCMAAIGRANIPLPDDEMTLLDYMVAEGKTLYFLEQTLPDANDTIITRYTSQQLDWMRKNEGNVWAYLVQNQLLYETDYSQLHNLLDDAPKTNAFGDGSAPRSVAYIGWQIVRRYAKKTKTSLPDLMENTDARQILQQSSYRP
ncbi:MAG: hypothetical protein IJ789_06735 [Bacteroidales bacterium]|nr:hypothetical protein [Bacteroidales bacterium]